MSEHGKYLGVNDGRSRTGPIPPRRPEDQRYMDALDRLDDYLGRAERLAYEHKAEWVGLFQGGTSDLATVREALERQREELDSAYDRGYDRAAEEVTNKLEGRAESAEAEVRRLTEEAQRGQEPLANLILDATTIRQAHKIARAALLSASPSDGPDDFCEHGYTTENAAHPSAGLERCPTCSPTDGGGEAMPEACPYCGCVTYKAVNTSLHLDAPDGAVICDNCGKGWVHSTDENGLIPPDGGGAK